MKDTNWFIALKYLAYPFFLYLENISEFQIRWGNTKTKRKVIKIIEINRDKYVSFLLIRCITTRKNFLLAQTSFEAEFKKSNISSSWMIQNKWIKFLDVSGFYYMILQNQMLQLDLLYLIRESHYSLFILY